MEWLKELGWIKLNIDFHEPEIYIWNNTANLIFTSENRIILVKRDTQETYQGFCKSKVHLSQIMTVLNIK